MDNRDVLILIVDDDAAVRETLRAMIAMEGYRVDTASDGAEALEKVAKIQPDVLLLDVMMPGLDGFEVTRRLKGDVETFLISIILVTALDSRQERMRGIEAGADDFLNKPIDRLQLLTRVANAARLRRVIRELDDAETVLESLARSIEAKDKTTGNHCDRLMRESEGFGAFLGLLPAAIRTLHRASVLHDVGKIGVPEAVLLKNGPLTPGEWEVMKTHSQIGESLLTPLRTMHAVLAIVRHHHERWDGGGYPEGLSGEAIPYLARVFQIMDSFDALTHERPYKTALSPEKALRILLQETAEGKWDPDVMASYIAWKGKEGLAPL